MLDELLAQIRGEKSSIEGICVSPDKIGATGLRQIVDAIDTNPCEWLSITFYSGFSDVANALVSRRPSATTQKSKRLSLTFRHAQIIPADVVSLLQHPQCPFGLELAFINCTDTDQRISLYESKNAHASFKRALDDNDKVIGFSIHTSQDSHLVGEGLTSHNWLSKLSMSLVYNERRFGFMKLIEEEKNESVKQLLVQSLMVPANDKKLHDYCQSTPYIQDIYQLFKGIIELNEDNIKEGFKSLTHHFTVGCKCEQEAHEILADYMYGNQLEIEGQSSECPDEETNRLNQEYIDARNLLILWLLRRSDIRGTYSPLITSCIQQLQRQPDSPTSVTTAPKKLLITSEELERIVDGISSSPNTFFANSSKSFPKDHSDHLFFPHQLEYLKNEKVKLALQAKFGTSDVEVLEDVICRGYKATESCQTMVSGASAFETSHIWFVVDDAQKTLTSFFDQIEFSSIPTPPIAAAAASALACMR